MKDHLLKIAKFFHVCVEPKQGNTIESHQYTLDELIPEELEETIAAVDLYKLFLACEDITPERTEELLHEIVDGYQDMVYLCDQHTLKIFLSLGFSDEEAAEKVMEVKNRIADANLAKLDAEGKPTWSEKGKVLKPEGWVEPNHRDLFRKDSTQTKMDV